VKPWMPAFGYDGGWVSRRLSPAVIPAKAGIQRLQRRVAAKLSISAVAGMTADGFNRRHRKKDGPLDAGRPLRNDAPADQLTLTALHARASALYSAELAPYNSVAAASVAARACG